MNLLNAVRAFCHQLEEGSTCWIAYSGGLDSQVLLSLCHQLRAETKNHFRVLHINHGISANATSWADHCRKTCASYGMDYIERSIQLDLQAGDSLEAVARAKRYAVFAEYLKEGDMLLTAHHQDDQAETVLLQLLRGSGMKGLAAMPAIKSFACGYHARPLLTFSRADIFAYATEKNLRWVDDESNDDTRLTRNFIRHEILSRLTSRWPSASAAISRSAAHCAESQTLLEHFSQNLQCAGSREHTLSVAKLLALNPLQQKLVLRSWIQQLNFPLPDTRKMNTILRDVLPAACDRQPKVEWGGVMLRRYRDDLYLLPVRAEIDTQAEYAWNLQTELELPQWGVLKVCGSGLRSDIKNVTVRFRQGGEVLELPGRGRHTLKNLFQEWGVPPWERACLPLIYAKEKLIAIPGYFLHADYAEEERGRSKQHHLIPTFSSPSPLPSHAASHETTAV
jgi:tRNA(Ile)-lysidine synthase